MNKVFSYSHPRELKQTLETLSEKHRVFILIKDDNNWFDSIVNGLKLENKLNIIEQEEKKNIIYRLYSYKS